MIILPLFYENRFITNFKNKTELLNSLFDKQCTVINNGSSLQLELSLKTNNFLSNITFSSNEILKIIQNLDSDKAHGHQRISIRMLKICRPSIFKRLEIIFDQCLEGRIFPIEWKKVKVVLVHEKMTNNLWELLVDLTSSNMWKKYLNEMFNNMFHFFITNQHISTN